jgi:uncharacterized protein YbbK (DUF523 family)
MKIAVSKCLLGHKCRYDAKDKKNDYILSLQDRYTIVPICPEDDAFGTPRETIRVVQEKSRLKVYTNETNKDLSKKLNKEIIKIYNILKSENINKAILKAKSPSCGYGSVKIYDIGNNIVSCSGNGLLADYLDKNIKDMQILDETSATKL